MVIGAVEVHEQTGDSGAKKDIMFILALHFYISNVITLYFHANHMSILFILLPVCQKASPRKISRGQLGAGYTEGEKAHRTTNHEIR